MLKLDSHQGKPYKKAATTKTGKNAALGSQSVWNMQKIGYRLPYVLGRGSIILATIEISCISNSFRFSYYPAKHFISCSVFGYFATLSCINLHQLFSEHRFFSK